jgi:hypothetical protein
MPRLLPSGLQTAFLAGAIRRRVEVVDRLTSCSPHESDNIRISRLRYADSLR